MKTALALLLLLLEIQLSADAQTSRKSALLIAVGDYPATTGWQKINSENDADLVKNTLLRQGFEGAEIFVLKNADATREGILQAIRSRLLDRVRAGDVVWFQFSGHGQQVADDNGDEVDGFDEAIVPVNSPMRYDPDGYRGENLIRDDELGKVFHQIRQKLTASGSLTVVLDACHSGTGTRGNSIARGTTHVMADTSFRAPVSRGGGNSATLDGLADDTNLASLTAFFGASANQLNFEARDDEGRQVGSLTYALCKKLAAASPATSWRSLFEEVRTEMAIIAPRQNPQAEGTLDQQILGGNLLGKADFIRVSRWNDAQSVGIEAGWMHGMNEGTVVGLFPPDTRAWESATPLAKGKITACTPFESAVELETALSQEQARSAWAFVLEQNFGDLKVPVAVNLPEGHPLRQPILDKFSKIPAVQLGTAAPEITIAENTATANSRGAAGVVVSARGNMVLEEIEPQTSPEVAAQRIARKILGYAQADFLRKIQQFAPAIQLQLEIVPIELDRRTMLEKMEINRRDALGNLTLREGDIVKLRVTNAGSRAAYFTLLDIQPDNQINILLPSETETPAELRAAPGQTVVVPRFFEIAPPFGVEMFKLIATDQPIDLRPIAQSRGASGTKSGSNPLEQLFSQTFLEEGAAQSRGGKTIGVATGAMHTSTVTFTISN